MNSVINCVYQKTIIKIDLILDFGITDINFNFVQKINKIDKKCFVSNFVRKINKFDNVQKKHKLNFFDYYAFSTKIIKFQFINNMKFNLKTIFVKFFIKNF